VPLYIGYFGLGIYAHLNGWFSAEGYRPRLLPWVGVWLISGLLYLGNRLFVMPASPEPTLVIQMAHAILFNGFCLSSLMAGAALFQQRINGAGQFWSSLAANSYGIYYIHPLILYPLAYLFVPVSLPLFVKAPLVILLGIVLSWAASTLVLTRVTVVRRSFA
jgi:glucan biosynthesis protein C